MDLKEEIIAHFSKIEDSQIDHPFKKFPDCKVLRHKENRKWYGLIMNVEKEKLNLSGAEKVDVIDIKADPELVSILQNSAGYLPAYHMDKKHWITILLDGTVEKKQIFKLLEDSYSMTK